jgi:hypothetical protein
MTKRDKTRITKARPGARRSAPSRARKPSRTTTEKKTLARLARDLAEALERQTATAEILQVISTSPGELEPVFKAMLENATRICQASFGNLLLYDGEVFRHVALHNAPPAWAAEQERDPVPPRGLARVLYRASPRPSNSCMLPTSPAKIPTSPSPRLPAPRPFSSCRCSARRS